LFLVQFNIYLNTWAISVIMDEEFIYSRLNQLFRRAWQLIILIILLSVCLLFTTKHIKKQDKRIDAIEKRQELLSKDKSYNIPN